MEKLDKQVLLTVEKWKNAQLQDELKKELETLSDSELIDAFYKDLEFGTGGMRGVIGVGTNRMNIYTLRKANYGYAKYLLENDENPSVVIAYDCRHKSIDFAKESARVLAKFGIKTYLFKKITPTPELSFAIRHLKATGGIVVTASHNPPKYNGYKIYDCDGCQLVPELADKVINYIANSPDPLTMVLESFEELEAKKMIVWLDDDIDCEYLKNVKSIVVNNDTCKDNFKVCFTSLHGTSTYLGPRLLEEMGYKYVLTKEQMVPDPNFSTLILPNPEDKRAFDLAIKYAKENDADICIATDPDADRVGLAVKHNGEYVLLTGNQTGALLIEYLAKYRKVNKKGVIFNTIVTSPLGVVIGEKYGFEHYSTLTGFKYIGEQAKKLESSDDKMFFFGYEESYGYVIKDFVRDKDSLQALLLCSEMACFYKNQGKDLVEVLNNIYEEYGYYLDDLVNIGLEGKDGQEKIGRILNHFRKLKNNIDFEIDAIEDYEESIRYDYKEDNTSKLLLPKSNVIKYFLSDGSFFVLRPSGTEPKMKVYLSVRKETKEKAIIRNKEIKDKVMEIVNSVK